MYTCTACLALATVILCPVCARGYCHGCAGLHAHSLIAGLKHTEQLMI